MKNKLFVLDGDPLVSRLRAFVRERMVDASGYRGRGSFKEDDLLIGGLGEIAVYRFLQQKSAVFPPDFAMHKKKSYSSDLKVNLDDTLVDVHVKTQTYSSRAKYGASWIFQRKDPVVKNDGDHGLSRVFLLTEATIERDLMDNGVTHVFDYLVKSPASIHRDNMFCECKLESHRATKVALYAEETESGLTLIKREF